MQRRTSSSQRYVKSGIPGHVAPGGRRASMLPQIIKRVIIGALVLAAGLLVVYGITSLVGNSGLPVLIGASPTDNMRAFGDSVLHYDGMTLRCIGPNGAEKWGFTLGVGADFHCTNTRVVAWLGNQLYVLDKSGNPTFNDRMEGQVRFARVGDTYIAACVGEQATSSSIQVFDHNGVPLESLKNDLDGLYVMDVGFFSSKQQLMWVLSLDIDGNAPITNIKTYEPGRMTTGSIELDNELVYKIYPYNNLLMAVNTTKIQAYNYKCVEDINVDPVLVYGWLVRSVRSIGKNTYALLEQMPSNDLRTFSELRLVTNGQMSAMRLLTPCFASGLSEKGVYGFGENVIYYAPFGQTIFKEHYLQQYKLSDLICMLDGGRAVVVIGSEVRILTLPS